MGLEVGQIIPAFVRLENPKIFKLEDEFSNGEMGVALEEAHSVGHDGVIFEYSKGGEGFWAGKWGAHRDYVVFDPTQIKSIFNRGTFYPADPRILFDNEIAYHRAAEEAELVKPMREHC